MSETEKSNSCFELDEGIYISTEWGIYYGPFDSAGEAHECINTRPDLFDGHTSTLMVGMRFVDKVMGRQGRDSLEMATVSIKSMKKPQKYLDFYD